MTLLLIGLTLTLVVNGITMNLLERAFHAPSLAAHHFAPPKGTRATEDEKRWLYALNTVLSLLILYGAIVFAFPWLFTEADTSVGWIVAQAAGILLVYDALYYALHRWVFHHRKLMRFAHGLHHSARTPSARESIFTHPTELVAGLAVLLLSIWLVGPVHVWAFLLANLVYSQLNLVIHSGVEFPRGVLRVLNAPARAHHGHHGVDMNKNFASLTPIWDRVFGTAI